MRRNLIGMVITVLFFAAFLAGCAEFGNQTTRDLEGVRMQEPYAVQAFVNADQFPNLELFCITQDGPTFLITTREYHQPQVYSETCVLEEGTGQQQGGN